MTYPHQHIWINGRNVLMKDIVDGLATAHSEFEKNTFDFIRQWMSEQREFTIHTSGSTGEPKPMSIFRTQMVASAKMSGEALGFKPEYTTLLCLDPKYIAGKMLLARSLVWGMRIEALDPVANPLVNIPVDNTSHVASFVPHQVKTILESKHPHLLDNLLIVLIGGAAVSHDVRQQLLRFSCKCYATYGMTETISHIALQRVNGERLSQYFEVLPGIEIQTDPRGCLVVDAPYLADKVVTNDLVEIVDKGKFRWLGRWDNVINTGGVKVIPEKIEGEIDKLFKCLNINNAFFIYGVPDEAWGSKVVLVIEDSMLDATRYDAFIQSLVQTLAPAERPKELLLAADFERTETGKINRSRSFKNVRLNITIKK